MVADDHSALLPTNPDPGTLAHLGTPRDVPEGAGVPTRRASPASRPEPRQCANRLAAPVRFKSAGRHAQRPSRSLAAPPWHTLAHRAVCQGEPVCQLSAQAIRLSPSLGSVSIDSQRPCGSNPQVATPSARPVHSPPHLGTPWHTGTPWHICANRRCARICKLKSAESSFAQVSSTNGGGHLRAGTLAHLYLFFLLKKI